MTFSFMTQKKIESLRPANVEYTQQTSLLGSRQKDAEVS